MDITLHRTGEGRYTVFVGGAEYGRLVRSSWDGRWQAFTRGGVPIGTTYGTRDEAAERLLG